MRRTRSRSARTSAADRTRGQHGFTLVEMMIVTMLFAIVIVVIFDMLGNVQKSETFARGRGQALDDMRITMDRMTKELRQATSVAGTPTASRIDFYTYVNGASTHLVYNASGTTLTRQAGSAPATTMQQNLTTTSIFSYPVTGTTQVVDINLVVAPPNLPSTTVSLVSEVRLRNLGS